MQSLFSHSVSGTTPKSLCQICNVIVSTHIHTLIARERQHEGISLRGAGVIFLGDQKKMRWVKRVTGAVCVCVCVLQQQDVWLYELGIKLQLKHTSRPGRRLMEAQVWCFWLQTVYRGVCVTVDVGCVCSAEVIVIHFDLNISMLPCVYFLFLSI